MTLDTEVYVLDEIDPHDLFHKVRELLGANDSHPYTDEPSKWSKDSGMWLISNQIGIGLPALLMQYYRPDGRPVRTAEQAARCEDYCDDDCDRRYHDQPCWIEVSLDTAYGYKDELGRGCGDLHACLVAELGEWLDGRGVRWSWKNEFSGEVWTGEDRYVHLTDLMTTGAEAAGWFREKVIPAITGRPPADA